MFILILILSLVNIYNQKLFLLLKNRSSYKIFVYGKGQLFHKGSLLKSTLVEL